MFLALKENNLYLGFNLFQQILSLIFTVIGFYYFAASVENRLVALLFSLIICVVFQVFFYKKKKSFL